MASLYKREDRQVKSSTGNMNLAKEEKARHEHTAEDVRGRSAEDGSQ